MRKSAVVVIAFCALAALAFPAGALSARATKFHAKLSARPTVPHANSKGKGRATFTLARNGKSIRYRLSAKGLTGPPIMAHIHLGRPGVAGGIILAISTKPFSLPAQGRITAKDFTAVGPVKTFKQAVKAMRAGKTYVNVHTKKFPAGEIRGQVHLAGRAHSHSAAPAPSMAPMPGYNY